MRFSLSSKILTLVMVVLAILLAVSMIFIRSRVQQEVEERLEQELSASRRVLLEVQGSRLERLALLARSSAEAPRFKATIDEGDPATVLDTGRDELAIVKADLLLVTDGGGRELARLIPEALPVSDVAAIPVVASALAGTGAQDIWRVGTRLFQVASSPVAFGDEISGTLTLGKEVADEVAQDIHRLTGTDVVFFAARRPVASSLDAVSRNRVHSELERRGWIDRRGEVSAELAIGGHRYRIRLLDLEDRSGNVVGRCLLQRSLDRALEYLRQLESSLIRAASAVALLGLLLASLLSRRLTRPVAALMVSTRQVQEGNYDEPVEISSSDEIGELAARFDEMRSSLKDHIEQLKTAERMKRDMELAREIQMGMLPSSAPSVPGLELAGCCVPANDVGGDYFDYLIGSRERLELIIADVSGHSTAAALMMAMARLALRSEIDRGCTPGESLAAANRLLFQDLAEGSMFVSVFHCSFAAETRELTYACAGHNPPLLLRASTGQFETLSADGILLGILEEPEFEEATTRLEPGDMLCLYTDGIVEEVDRDEEEFGEKRLEQILKDRVDETPARIAEAVMEAVRGHAAGRELEDDITLIVLKMS